MTEPAIMLRSLTRTFNTGSIKHVVLNEIDVDVYAGELTLVKGPSGSGKSTLLAVASGLLRPDSGTVCIGQTDLWRLAPAKIDAFRLERFGFVFQGFNLFSSLTAIEQVIYPMQLLSLEKTVIHRAACLALDAVGLADKHSLYPAEMSGGEKQRVAIARALVKNPNFLFADEPTSSLDKANGEMIIDLLRRVAHSLGATVICVTHDQRLVSHADRVLTIEDGRITADVRPGN